MYGKYIEIKNIYNYIKQLDNNGIKQEEKINQQVKHTFKDTFKDSLKDSLKNSLRDKQYNEIWKNKFGGSFHTYNIYNTTYDLWSNS